MIQGTICRDIQGIPVERINLGVPEAHSWFQVRLEYKSYVSWSVDVSDVDWCFLLLFGRGCRSNGGTLVPVWRDVVATFGGKKNSFGTQVAINYQKVGRHLFERLGGRLVAGGRRVWFRCFLGFDGHDEVSCVFGCVERKGCCVVLVVSV